MPTKRIVPIEMIKNNWIFWSMLTPQLCFPISVYGKTTLSFY